MDLKTFIILWIRIDFLMTKVYLVQMEKGDYTHGKLKPYSYWKRFMEKEYEKYQSEIKEYGIDYTDSKESSNEVVNDNKEVCQFKNGTSFRTHDGWDGYHICRGQCIPMTEIMDPCVNRIKKTSRCFWTYCGKRIDGKRKCFEQARCGQFEGCKMLRKSCFGKCIGWNESCNGTCAADQCLLEDGKEKKCINNDNGDWSVCEGKCVEWKTIMEPCINDKNLKKNRCDSDYRKCPCEAKFTLKDGMCHNLTTLVTQNPPPKKKKQLKRYRTKRNRSKPSRTFTSTLVKYIFSTFHLHLYVYFL